MKLLVIARSESDEAIQSDGKEPDCFASLAMTSEWSEISRANGRVR